jgi:peptide/nickel transport system substrate-binding protein
MTSFCTGFQALKLPSAAGPELAAVNGYMATHQISGISLPNSSTIAITLDAPSSSFINIMAMPMSSPVPSEEILKYLPGSVQEQENFVSDGPYTITKYVPGVSFHLVRNPDWQASTDSLRHQYFNAINVTEGESATSIQQQLETGGADLEWDTTVPPVDVQQLISAASPQYLSAFIGGITYLAFNMKSTADGGALQKPAVREAIQYCVDKTHLVQVTGGPSINAPANQILPPQMNGFKQIDPYPSANLGDPAKCKAGLTAAGYPKGITLTMTYPNNPPAPAQFAALQADMAKGGVTLKGDEQPSQGAYFNYIETDSNRPHWDLAYGAWFPDWQGNAAQSFFSPLLDGRHLANGSTNYGAYNDPTIDSDIDAALKAPTVAAASTIWAAADDYAMTQDPPWIPLLYNALPQFIGPKVENAEYNGFIGYVDITNLWKT